MMQKLTFVVQQGRWILAHCPRDGEEVVGSGLAEVFAIPDGEASWWYCPACQGWHVLINSYETNNCHNLNNGGLTEKEHRTDPIPLRDELKAIEATRPVTAVGLTPTYNTTSLWEYLWPRQDQIDRSFS